MTEVWARIATAEVVWSGPSQDMLWGQSQQDFQMGWIWGMRKWLQSQVNSKFLAWATVGLAETLTDGHPVAEIRPGERWKRIQFGACWVQGQLSGRQCDQWAGHSEKNKSGRVKWIRVISIWMATDVWVLLRSSRKKYKEKEKRRSYDNALRSTHMKGG